MFDVKELDRWKPVGKEACKFTTKFPRKVRLEVLAEELSKLYVKTETATQFIGNFEGYGVVAFAVPGPFELTARGGPVKVWTQEFESGGVEVPDSVSFTRIVPERARNPEVDRMMQKMMAGVERRMAAQQRDMANLLAQNEKRRELAERAVAQLLEREAKEREETERARREVDASDGSGSGAESDDQPRPPAKGGRKDAAAKSA